MFEDGRIKLANNRQLCLDVCGGRLEAGSKVILYPVKPDDDEGRCNQLWILNHA